MECLSPLDAYTHSHGILMARMSDADDSIDLEYLDHSMPNSWLASAPNHPFWVFTLHRMKGIVESRSYYSVESLSGSVFLHDTYKDWIHSPKSLDFPTIKLLNNGLVYGFDWRVQEGHDDLRLKIRKCSAQSSEFDSKECKSLLSNPDAIMVSYFTKVWDDVEMEDRLNIVPIESKTEIVDVVKSAHQDQEEKEMQDQEEKEMNQVDIEQQAPDESEESAVEASIHQEDIISTEESKNARVDEGVDQSAISNEPETLESHKEDLSIIPETYFESTRDSSLEYTESIVQDVEIQQENDAVIYEE